MLLTDIKLMNIEGKDVKSLYLNGTEIWSGGKPYDSLWDAGGYGVKVPSGYGLILDYVPKHTTRVKVRMQNIGYKTTSSYAGDWNVFFGANENFYFMTQYNSTNSFVWRHSNGSSNYSSVTTSGNSTMFKYEQVRTIDMYKGVCRGGAMMDFTPNNDKALTSRLVLGQYGENPPTGYDPCTIVVIYCEVWEEIDGVLTKIRDFYPAQKDGVYGLYDRITGVFCSETTHPSGETCSLQSNSTLFTLS